MSLFIIPTAMQVSMNSCHTVFGYIIGTLHRMVNAGITKIVVKTIISACDIIFYHLVCYQED